MLIHDVEQGSAQWFALRIGIPTASDFDQIITPARGDLSKSWKKYAARLIWEKVMNTTTQSLAGIAHIEEGKRLEPIAVRHFEFTNEVITEKVGFVTTDDGLIGASPDRFIVKNGSRAGTLEVKCPTGPVHMFYALFGHEEKYRPQIQGQLYVCEMDEGVFLSFMERAPAYETRTYRDEAYIKKLHSTLDEFLDNLQEFTAAAMRLGVYQAFTEIQAPVDLELGSRLKEEINHVVGPED